MGKHRNLAAIFVIFMLAFGSLAGCNGASDEQSAPVDENAGSTVRVVTDQIGREVELPGEINRVVLVSVPFAAAYYAVVGSMEKAVGIHPLAMTAADASMLSIMAPEIKNASTGFVKGSEVNTEELLKLNPDIVFQWSGYEKEMSKLERAGLTVAGMEANVGDEHSIESWFRIIGEVMEKEERADKLIEYHRRALENISNRIESIPEDKRVKAITLTNVEDLQVADYCWVDVAGAKNLVEGCEWGQSVDMEQIYEWNPDVIYIGNFCDDYPEDILQNKVKGQDWSSVEAVKKGRVYKVPLGEYRWDPPCAEWSLMFKWCAQKNYPDVFDDYDMEEEIKEFYSSIFEYEINDEQIKMILNPKPTGNW